MPVSFFSISEVYPPKLKTEEKRLHLTLENVDLYNRAIQDAGLLVPDGALYLVDMHHLTQGGRPRALRLSFGPYCANPARLPTGFATDRCTSPPILESMSSITPIALKR